MHIHRIMANTLRPPVDPTAAPRVHSFSQEQRAAHQWRAALLASGSENEPV